MTEMTDKIMRDTLEEAGASPYNIDYYMADHHAYGNHFDIAATKELIEDFDAYVANGDFE